MQEEKTVVKLNKIKDCEMSLCHEYDVLLDGVLYRQQGKWYNLMTGKLCAFVFNLE